MPLTSEEKFVLTLGHKFILPSSVSDLDFQQYLSLFRRRVSLVHQLGTSPPPPYFAPNPSYQPDIPPAAVGDLLNSAEWSLLTAFKERPVHEDKRHFYSRKVANGIKSLREREDGIVIKPADKNLGLTIMTQDWYHDQVLSHLKDDKTYQPATHEDIKAAITVYEALVKERFHQDEKLNKFLLMATENYSVPAFYIIPKLHKNPPSSRPISASHSFFSSPLCKWINDRLLPLTQQHTSRVLHSSYQLTQTLAATKVPDNTMLMTGDVSSLYPSIPTRYALNRISGFLRKHLPDQADLIIDALRFVLNNHFVEYKGEIYKQIAGTAMGVQFAPAYANIIMFLWEESAVGPRTDLVLYRRYIDDLLIAASPATLHSIQARFNNLPHFNIEWEAPSLSVNFLDLTIQINNDNETFQYKPYAKAISKFLYIPYLSFHPRHAKRGMIKTELIRFARLSYNETTFMEQRSIFYFRLRARGYPVNFLKPIFQQYKSRNDLINETTYHNNNDDKAPLILTMPLSRFALRTKIREHVNPSLKLTEAIKNTSRYAPNTKLIIAYKYPKSIGNSLIRARTKAPPKADPPRADPPTIPQFEILHAPPGFHITPEDAEYFFTYDSPDDSS